METEKVTISEKFQRFTEFWSPKIIGELNGQQVKAVRMKGSFVWHRHDHEDEMFLVIRGVLRMEFRDKSVTLGPGEFIIVPRETEHRPVADDEVEALLFEPAGTLNTGNINNERTRATLERI